MVEGQKSLKLGKIYWLLFGIILIAFTLWGTFATSPGIFFGLMIALYTIPRIILGLLAIYLFFVIESYKRSAFLIAKIVSIILGLIFVWEFWNFANIFFKFKWIISVQNGVFDPILNIVFIAVWLAFTIFSLKQYVFNKEVNEAFNK